MCKTDYGGGMGGGGRGKNVPKIDYVISERPHIVKECYSDYIIYFYI